MFGLFKRKSAPRVPEEQAKAEAPGGAGKAAAKAEDGAEAAGAPTAAGASEAAKESEPQPKAADESTTDGPSKEAQESEQGQEPESSKEANASEAAEETPGDEAAKDTPDDEAAKETPNDKAEKEAPQAKKQESGFIQGMIDKAIDSVRPSWYTEEFEQALGTAQKIFSEKLHANVMEAHGLEPESRNEYPYLLNLGLLRKAHLAEVEREGTLTKLGTVAELDEQFLARAEATLAIAQAVYMDTIPETGWTARNVYCAELVGVDVSCPRYAILVDHLLRAVVIVVRGTETLADAVIDALCDETPIGDKGVAHSGFLSGAKKLLEIASQQLTAALKRHPDYDCITCGHSLGGGVAILCGALLHIERTVVPAKTKIEVWAFAPGTAFAPVENFPICETFRVNAFVHYADLVPRLSLRGGFRMYHALVGVDKLDISGTQRAAYIASSDPLPEDVQEQIAQCIAKGEAAVPMGEFPIMTLPGDIYYLLPTDVEERQVYTLKRITAGELADQLAYNADCCLTDHLGGGYMTALKRIEPPGSADVPASE